MSVPSAKAAIQTFCHALQLLGLPTLPPEHVRQAKFAAGTDFALWRVLHDAMVWSLVRTAARDTAAAAIAKLWTSIAHEQLEHDSSTFAQEGKDFVAQQLLDCGCPQPLVLALLSAAASTRHLLMCLVWVASHSRLLQTAVHQVALPMDALLRLPPYPEDTRCCPGTCTAYSASARLAAAHSHTLLNHLGNMMQTCRQGVQQPVPRSSTGLVPANHRKSPGVSSRAQPGQLDTQQLWGCVDTGANMLLSLLGKSRAAQLSLQSHMEAVARLTGEVQAVQSHVWPRTSPLSCFELHLLQQPALAQQCVCNLQAASQVLSQQAHLVSGGHMFYMWALSVIQEEAVQAGGVQAEAREGQTRGKQAEGAAQQVDGAGVSSSMPSLGGLPEPGTPGAGLLLRKLQQQVMLAANQAELAGLPVFRHAGTGRAAHQPGAGASGHFTAEHFRRLARASIPFRSGSAAATQPQGGQQDEHARLWELPADITEALACADGPGAGAGGCKQQQQQQAWVQQQVWQHVGSSVGCELAKGGAGWKGGAENQPPLPVASTVQDETNRLLEATLSVARSLAHVRGVHKQALQAVSKHVEAPFLVTGLE